MNPRSQLFSRPPRWFRVRHSPGRTLPPQTVSWLFEAGSLTRRLRILCGKEFRLRLLGQHWCRPFAEEARALRLSAGRRAVVREVAMQWGEQPLVLARSIIPAKTLRGVDRRLAHLGTRPLGEILFADPRLQRRSLELTEVEPRLWLKTLRAGGELSRPVWGRRSRYSLGQGHTLLVAEFFLPELFALERKP